VPRLQIAVSVKTRWGLATKGALAIGSSFITATCVLDGTNYQFNGTYCTQSIHHVFHNARTMLATDLAQYTMNPGFTPPCY
jgi:hypothetical protein